MRWLPLREGRNVREARLVNSFRSLNSLVKSGSGLGRRDLATAHGNKVSADLCMLQVRNLPEEVDSRDSLTVKGLVGVFLIVEGRRDGISTLVNHGRTAEPKPTLSISTVPSSETPAKSPLLLL